MAARNSPPERNGLRIVRLKKRADFLAAQRNTARTIEDRLLEELGPGALANLYRIVDALAGEDDLRMSDYLRQMRRTGGLPHLDE